MAFPPPQAARNFAWRPGGNRPGSRRQMLGRTLGFRTSAIRGARGSALACARLGRPGGADRRPAAGRCGFRLCPAADPDCGSSTATCPVTRPSPERIVRSTRSRSPSALPARGRRPRSSPDRCRRSSSTAIGFSHPGQTEFVAERCGVSRGNVAMMLAGPTLRTVPVTTHVPFAEVTEHLSSALIEARGTDDPSRVCNETSELPSRRSPSPASIRTPAKAGCSAARRSR